jgi:GNAT superfamily N-acetyltransferase
MSEIIETDSPDAADIAVIADGLRAYNTAMAGYDDYRPLAVFVTDPATGKVIGGLYGASSRGQLRVDRFFLPKELRRDRLGSRLLKMAEEEGRRRRCTRVTLNTMEIQAPGFYLKQGYEMAAKLDCGPPGVTRYVMTSDSSSECVNTRRRARGCYSHVSVTILSGPSRQPRSQGFAPRCSQTQADDRGRGPGADAGAHRCGARRPAINRNECGCALGRRLRRQGVSRMVRARYSAACLPPFHRS